MELTPEMTKELAKLDVAVRSRIEGVQYRQVAPTIEDEQPSERVLRFRTSDETVDAYGDIILVNGWDLGDWEKNRVFLWHHNRGLTAPMPPLATGVKDQLTKKALIQSFAFAPREVFPFADTVYKLYRGVDDPKLGHVRFLNMTSVGFRGLGYEVPDDKKRKKLGMGKYGVIFNSMLLKEVSGVTIPANPNASIINAWKAMADQKALVPDDLELLEERELLSDVLKDAWQETRGRLISAPPNPEEEAIIPLPEERKIKVNITPSPSGGETTLDQPEPDSESPNGPIRALAGRLDQVVRELRETKELVSEVKENLAELQEEVSVGLTVRATYAKHQKQDEAEASIDSEKTCPDWRDVFLDE